MFSASSMIAAFLTPFLLFVLERVFAAAGLVFLLVALDSVALTSLVDFHFLLSAALVVGTSISAAKFRSTA